MKILNKLNYNKVDNILQNILSERDNYTYYGINEKISDSIELEELVRNQIGQVIKISPGTSDRLAFKGFKDEIIKNIMTDRYYRWYCPPKGSLEARRALSIKENVKFDSEIYNPEDFCLTEGSTGAISMVFEYIKQNYQNGEIVIGGPTYYLYKSLASYYGLSYIETLEVKNINRKTTSFVSIDKIIQSITRKTKLIIINQPNNPTGEIYSKEDIKKLLRVAKSKGILLLVDQLFCELVYDQGKFIPTDKVAADINALTNLVIVNGFSKSKNMPALKIGYLYTKNKNLVDSLSLISEQRQCFASCSNFSDIICLDSFIKTVKQKCNLKNEKELRFILKKVRANFAFTESISTKSPEQLRELILDYNKYFNDLLNFYLETYNLCIDTFGNEVERITPNLVAFNTLFKISIPRDINYFDFCLNLYITFGVKTQIGPCFAYNQRTWQQDPDLGFWLRITFAREQKQLINGIKRFIEFKEQYFSNKKQFLNTRLIF